MAMKSPGSWRLPPRITRSRGGCERCRKRRQRCNKQRPNCNACTQAGSPCRYEIRLSWGGRPFRKSPFGKYLNNVEKLDNSHDGNGFVYSLPLTRPQLQQRPDKQQFSDRPTDSMTVPPVWEDGIDGVLIQLEVPPHLTTNSSSCHETMAPEPHSHIRQINDELDGADLGQLGEPCFVPPGFLNQTQLIPQKVHSLFQFYLSETMRLTVPGNYARTQICRFLVPASLQQPSLLYAIMTFAAIHIEATGNSLGIPRTLIDTFQSTSIRHLQSLLDNDDHASKVVALATARTLCQAQIYSGTSSWRIHLNGAKAILESSHLKDSFISSCLCSSTHTSFLSSWFNNAEALAALSPIGLLQGQLQVRCHSSSPDMSDVYFDIFGGVMSDLPDLFREVGALVQESRRRQQQQNHPSKASILSETDITLESEALIQEIHHRLQRDSAENLIISRNLPAELSPDEIQDYALSNAGFLYTALLHIQCSIRHLPALSTEAQFCVDKIVSCAQLMTRSSGLSPRVLLVAPLFTAGICAIGSARDAIRSALGDIEKWMRTPHLKKMLHYLEHIWQDDTLKTHPSSWSDEINFDFLPY